jgi:serine/threonine protein kinase
VEGEFFSSTEIYKVNLWKLGMLMYELTYHKLPFPIEYVANKVKHHENIKVHFPERDSHSIEFHHFLKSLICKDPIIRGMRTKGDARMSMLNPQIMSVLFLLTLDNVARMDNKG